MKTIYHTFLALVLAVPSAGAELGLKKALDMGLEGSELLKMYESKKESASQSLKEVKWSGLGSLNLKSAYTRGDEPVYAFAETMRQGDFSMASMATINNPSSVENFELGVEAGVPLFTGFKLANYRKMAEAGLKANVYAYDRAKAGVSFQVVYQYLTVLLRKQMLAAAEKAVGSSKKELETAARLKESGMVLGSDYYAALAIHAGLENYRSVWGNELETEKMKLKILLNAGGESLPEPKGFLSENDYALPPVEELLAEALKSRLDLRAWAESEKIAALKVSLEKNSLLPQIDAFGSFSGNTGSLDKMRTSGIYGIKMNVPIGDPGYSARLARTRSDLKSAGDEANYRKKNVETELRRAYAGYVSARGSAGISRDMRDKAALSLELFMPLYRQGRQSIIEVLRAEAALLGAEAGYLEAVYKTHLYYARTMLESEKISGETLAPVAAALGAE